MAIDISGIKPANAYNHGRMTIGEGTINYTKHYTPYSGMYQSAGTVLPTIATISGKFDSRWDNVEYYVGNTG